VAVEIMSDTAEIEENIKKATEFKIKGNDYFKAKEYDKACVSYSKLPLYLNHLTQGAKGVTEGHFQTINELKLAAFCNSATCYLKQSKLEQALDQVENALKVEADYPKAIWRRGQIYLERGNLDWARRDLRQAAKAFPTEATIRKELALVDEKEEKQKQKHEQEMRALGPKMKVKLEKDSKVAEEAEEEKKRKDEEEEKRKKEKGEKDENKGVKPGEGVFHDAMWRKLEMNPKTRQYLYDPYFVEKMRTLQQNPQLLKMYMMMKEPRIIDGVSVMLGFEPGALNNCHINGSMAPPPGDDFAKRRKKEKRRKWREERDAKLKAEGKYVEKEKKKKKKDKGDEENKDGDQPKEKKETEDEEPREGEGSEESDEDDDVPVKKDGDMWDSEDEMEERGPPPMSLRPEMGFARLRADIGLVKEEQEMLAAKWEQLMKSGLLDFTVNSVPNGRVLFMAKGDAMFKAKEFAIQQPEVAEFEWADVKFPGKNTHVPLKPSEAYLKQQAEKAAEESSKASTSSSSSPSTSSTSSTSSTTK